MYFSTLLYFRFYSVECYVTNIKYLVSSRSEVQSQSLCEGAEQMVQTFRLVGTSACILSETHLSRNA